MAVYRTVHLSFWTDPKVDDEFTPEDKYFYLYLLTNPHTNICGCYELGEKQCSRETGYNSETISRLLNRFQNVHDVIRYDSKTKEVLILNWHKYNWTSSEKLMKSVKENAAYIKSTAFKAYIESLIKNSDNTVSIPYPYPMDTSVTDTVTVSVPVTDNSKEGIVKGGEKSPDDELTEMFGYNEYLLEAVEDWLAYKKEKRQGYRGRGLVAFLTQIKNRVSEYGEDAVINVIQESMAQNYQGITWDKLKQQSRPQRNGTSFYDMAGKEINGQSTNSEDFSFLGI